MSGFENGNKDATSGAYESEKVWSDCMPHIPQALGIPKDMPMNDITWGLFHRAPQNAIGYQSGNRTFDLLWAQVMFASQAKMPLDGIGCVGMEISCVMDNNHNKAIKVVTRAGCKLMIFPVESGMMDPLDVRLINSRFLQDVVNEYGRITFAPMIETPDLIQLLCRLEEWTAAFILVHGHHKAGLPDRELGLIF